MYSYDFQTGAVDVSLTPGQLTAMMIELESNNIKSVNDIIDVEFKYLTDVTVSMEVQEEIWEVDVFTHGHFLDDKFPNGIGTKLVLNNSGSEIYTKYQSLYTWFADFNNIELSVVFDKIKQTVVHAEDKQFSILTMPIKVSDLIHAIEMRVVYDAGQASMLVESDYHLYNEILRLLNELTE